MTDLLHLAGVVLLVSLLGLGVATLVAALFGGAETVVDKIRAGVVGTLSHTETDLLGTNERIDCRLAEMETEIQLGAVPDGEEPPYPDVALVKITAWLYLAVFSVLLLADLVQTLAVFSAIAGVQADQLPLDVSGGWISLARGAMLVTSLAAGASVVFEALGFSRVRIFHRLPRWFRIALVAVCLLGFLATLVEIPAIWIYVVAATNGQADAVAQWIIAAICIAGATVVLASFISAAFLHLAFLGLWHTAVFIIRMLTGLLRWIISTLKETADWYLDVMADVAARVGSFPAAQREPFRRVTTSRSGPALESSSQKEDLMPKTDAIELGDAKWLAKLFTEGAEVGIQHDVRSGGGYRLDGSPILVPVPVTDVSPQPADLRDARRHAGDDEGEFSSGVLSTLEQRLAQAASEDPDHDAALLVSLGRGFDHAQLTGFFGKLKQRMRGLRIIGATADPALAAMLADLRQAGLVLTTVLLPQGDKQRLVARAMAALIDAHRHDQENPTFLATMEKLNQQPFVHVETNSRPLAVEHKRALFGKRIRGSVLDDTIAQTKALIDEVCPVPDASGCLVVLAPVSRESWLDRVKHPKRKAARQEFGDEIRHELADTRPHVTPVIVYANGATVPCDWDTPLYLQAALLTPVASAMTDNNSASGMASAAAPNGKVETTNAEQVLQEQAR